MPPHLIQTNVLCRAVGHRYCHLLSTVRASPALRQDVCDADLVVLCYGRDDLDRTVPMTSSDRYMPIPSRTVGQEAVEVIQELKSLHTDHLLQTN